VSLETESPATANGGVAGHEGEEVRTTAGGPGRPRRSALAAALGRLGYADVAATLALGNPPTQETACGLVQSGATTLGSVLRITALEVGAVSRSTARAPAWATAQAHAPPGIG
jgi:hypothetical protein